MGDSGVISKFLALFLLAGLTGLAACSTADPVAPLVGVAQPTLPTETPAFAGTRPEIIAADEIYHLTKAQEEAFLKYFDALKNRDVPPSKRLGRYLKRSTAAYEYEHATRTAGEVLRLKGGNCLSLANLTTALARVAGIDVGYQLITDLPIFGMDENIVVRSVHVRSKLRNSDHYTPTGNSVAGFQVWKESTGLIIDYFPSGNGRFIGNISEAKFSAMYYRNLAAEAISSKDFARAYWMVMKSLELAPDHPEGINMLAVVYRQAGDIQTAEKIYTYGISRTDDSISLLKNYRNLLTTQDRTEEAEKIDARLAEIQDSNPFDWWFMAEAAYEEANYAEALTYYRKSVKIAPYLHEGYFGLAKTHYQLGNVDSARKAMQRAVENANRLQTRTNYEAKLMALSGQQ